MTEIKLSIDNAISVTFIIAVILIIQCRFSLFISSTQQRRIPSFLNSTFFNPSFQPHQNWDCNSKKIFFLSKRKYKRKNLFEWKSFSKIKILLIVLQFIYMGFFSPIANSENWKTLSRVYLYTNLLVPQTQLEICQQCPLIFHAIAHGAPDSKRTSGCSMDH